MIQFHMHAQLTTLQKKRTVDDDIPSSRFLDACFHNDFNIAMHCCERNSTLKPANSQQYFQFFKTSRAAALFDNKPSSKFRTCSKQCAANIFSRFELPYFAFEHVLFL
jgi:hypothetical protein